MQIRPLNVWSYQEEYEEIREEILNQVDSVFKSGQLILGNYVKEFESNFSKYIGHKFGIGVNSGTDAIFLALKAIDVRHGDEIITVSNTAIPTVSAIVSSGAKPVFVDVKEDDYLIDEDQIKFSINKKTKAILVVHLFGQCANMDKILEIADQSGIYVIEDCAQSAGSSFNGKKSGSFGHLSAFSFYPTKLLGGYGDGGMVLTSNKKLSEKIRSLRMYGIKKNYYSELHGYNSRLDEVHASILNLKLKKLDKWILERRRIAEIYDSQLENILITPKENKMNFHAYYVYVVRSPLRDKIMENLKKSDIFLNISYPFPIHLMKGYKRFGYKLGDLPNTEKLAKEIFSLPMYPQLSNKDVLRVCSSIKSFYEN